MTEPTQDRPPPPPSRGYPLGLLFVLMASSGVLFGLVTPFVRAALNDRISPLAAIAVAAGAVFGVIVGALVGTFHFRRLLGAGIGAASGLAVGILFGLMVMSPADMFPELVAITLGGAAVLLVMAAAIGFSPGSVSNPRRHDGVNDAAEP